MNEDQERRRQYEAELGRRPAQGLNIPKSHSIGWTWIISLCLTVLRVIMPVLTPEIKELLVDFLVVFYHKAMATDNPWDDFLARFLLRILGIPVPAE